MRYLHYSPTPLGALRSVSQRQTPHHKPQGLWLSAGTAWADWCEAENFRTHALAHVQDCTHLLQGRRFLICAAPEDLRYVWEEFGELDSCGNKDIRWDRVAEQYDGILIPEHLAWDEGSEWYEMWDVGCACIWQ